MIALVPVREGSGGRAAIVGQEAEAAAREVRVARELFVWEAGAFRPAAWAIALAERLRDERIVVLPHIPDGRDLAPAGAPYLWQPERGRHQLALVGPEGGEIHSVRFEVR